MTIERLFEGVCWVLMTEKDLLWIGKDFIEVLS